MKNMIDVSTRMNRQLGIGTVILTKIENSTRRRETTRARPRPPPAESEEASKVRHDEQAVIPNGGPHLELARLRSKPGMNLTSRLHRRQVNISVHVFMRVVCVYCLYVRTIWFVYVYVVLAEYQVCILCIYPL